MAERTIKTRNGALTNSDGKYTFVETPTTDTLYWVDGTGWQIQPFMTSIYVKTNNTDSVSNKIVLPNSEDVKVGHTINIKFSDGAYANDEEFYIECQNDEVMSMYLGVFSSTVGGNGALINVEQTVGLVLGDVEEAANSFSVCTIVNTKNNGFANWQITMQCQVPNGNAPGDVYDI